MTATREQRRRKRKREKAKAAELRSAGLPSPDEARYLRGLANHLSVEHARGLARWMGLDAERVGR